MRLEATAFVPSGAPLQLRRQRHCYAVPSQLTTAPRPHRQPWRMRGPSTPAPDYSAIDRNPANILFTNAFLRKLENELGRPATTPGYAGAMEVVKALAARHRGDPAALQASSERVLESLFPPWMPPAFDFVFSQNVPRFAAWMNAAVTVVVTQWLMGPSKMADDGTTVEIERCRYLEEAGCVGICTHSCKAATESFFEKNMGIGLAIEPNLDDYSCKFRFGTTPLPESEDPMYQESCFATCPMSTVRDGSVCNSVRPIRDD